MISRRSAIASLGAAACVPRLPPVTDTIFELRNYRLQAGQRDTLIALFERAFVESQEAVGAHVLGTFRDLDAPDHFVWLRAFASMRTRVAALSAFYTGPTWHANRAAANATMIDVSDVHLLRTAGLPLRVPPSRPPIGATALDRAMYVVDIFALPDGDESAFAKRLVHGASVIATFATERSANNFPALPIQTDSVFVTLRRFGEAGRPNPIAGLPPPKQTLRLEPTPRSRLR